MTGKKRITTQLLPQGTASFRRERSSIRQLRTAARSCRDCDLWRSATQTVFGEGPQRARIVLIGEQPGNREDQEGHPFVGPAGRLLDKALADTGIQREKVYVTNVVKHFKFEQRGKLRLRMRDEDRDAAYRQLVRELSSIMKYACD